MRESQTVTNPTVSSLKDAWSLRRRLVCQLQSAPAEKRAAMEAALSGCDLLLNAMVQNAGLRPAQKNEPFGDPPQKSESAPRLDEDTVYAGLNLQG